MDEIRIIQGGISIDERGTVKYVNDFIMNDVSRFYIIHHTNNNVVRAWQAHQFEKKYLYVLEGAFLFAFVKIDNWEQPSDNLCPIVITIHHYENKILCIPQGYANGIKSIEPNSKVIVFSNKDLSESSEDIFRYDKDKWLDWNKY
ncbi:MAG: dTDP-6-deoxy-3,4-keto-hexulose isomerase [Bacteroidota bacterium]|nr:dTDP-6-deoxy-3,4-keto-hexulose isomerase [Bacteroidota bacterium]